MMVLRRREAEEQSRVREEAAGLRERLRAAEEERTRLLEERKQDQERVLELNRRITATESKYASAEERLRAQREYLEELKGQTRREFENLANSILDAKARKFTEQNETTLKNVLGPLDIRIKEFQERVDSVYNQEAKERFALKGEVQKLMELNLQMSQEASNLTRALKGDSKFQGDWGEMVLERILESSGLREGVEYQTQQQHTDDDGGRFKPDVIINLPENKHIIIDSKVSLKAYELYCSSEDSATKEQYLASHVKSVKDHVDELADKHYARLKNVNSPDFVFMFMPIEAAYVLAMQGDPELSMKAWRKNVAIVTATTLFTNLKTVASIWRLDNQNKNAQQIAHEAGRLYDKFVGFMESFEDVGKSIEKARTVHGEALNKLKLGPGNVFRKIEQLRELGATPTKRIKAEHLEE